MAKNELVKGQTQAPQGREQESGIPTYIPYVDIYGSRDESVIEVEMPGVDEKSIDVTIENGILTIDGRTAVTPPEGHRIIREEFASGHYRREFELTSEVSQDGIKAAYRNGLLRLTLPKGETAKARKIAVSV